MNFQGSITPPLSDGEDWDDKSELNALPSPVLKQKCTKSKVLATKPCEASLDEQYYEASCDLMVLGKKISGHPFATNGEICLEHLNKFLDKISSSLLCKDSEKQPDAHSQICELLFALSNHIFEAVGDKIISLVQALSRNFIDPLHHCGNPDIIECFHCFCSINSLLVNVVQAVKCSHTLQTVQVYHSNGLLVAGDANHLNKTINRILQDMACLCARIFQSSSISSNARARWNCTYPCTCFNELLLKCHSSLTPEKFWAIVSSLINSCILASSNKGGNSAESSPLQFNGIYSALSFSWYWVKDMPYHNIACCHNLINRLLRLSLANCGNCDLQLAFHIACYKKALAALQKSIVGRSWKPAELAGFNLLWQNISLRLCPGKNSLSSETIIDVSVQEWITETCNLQNYYDKDMECLDSFKMFLSVFDFLLSIDEGSVWVSVKDRFFLRLQPSLMKQLSENGLQHYFSIALVALRRCPVSTGSATLENFLLLLDHCLINPLCASKHNVYVSGLFAVMLVCIKRNIDHQLISKKAGKCFQKLSKLLVNNSLKSEQRHLVLESISQFFNCCGDFLRVASSFPPDLSLLMPASCLGLITNKLRSNESGIIVDFLSELLMCSRMKVTESDQSQIDKFCLSFVDVTLPWLQKLIFHNNSQDFSQLITDLTLFASSKSTSSALSTFSELWTYYASECHLDVLCRLVYLNNCLNHKSLLNLINHETENDPRSSPSLKWSDCAIRGWIQCVVVLQDVNRDLVQSLTRSISKIKVMSEMMAGDLTDLTFEDFLEKLASEYKSSKNFLERVGWTNKANLWFNSTVDVALKSIKDEKYVRSVYSIVALIIKRCSLLLHAGKPSIVSRCLDNLVLHSSRMKSNDFINNIIFVHLDKFIIGCLAIGTKDVYISQVLKEIINTYLTKWPCSSASEIKHPFLRVMLAPPSDDALVTFLLYLHRMLVENFHIKNLAMIVELLHMWASQAKSHVDRNELPDFRLALSNVRPQLRNCHGMLEKVEFLLQFFL